MLAVTVAAVPPDARFGRRGFAAAGQRCAEKALREVQPTADSRVGEFRQPDQQFVILLEAFAETDAGVENDLRVAHTARRAMAME